MQLEIKKMVLPAIEWNFEPLKKELAEQLEKYQKIVVTEDDLPRFKDERTKLNKLSEALNKERIRIERECTEPVKAFKTQVDELIQEVKKPMAEMDSQLKKFEEKRKQEKREAIEARFAELNDIPEIKLSMIFDDSWLNVSTTMKKITDAIKAHIEKVKADIQTITDLNVDYETELQEMYLKSFNLATVIQEHNNRVKIIAQAEAKRKEREAQDAANKAEAERLAQAEKEAEAQAKIKELENQLQKEKAAQAAPITEPELKKAEEKDEKTPDQQVEVEQVFRMEFFVRGTKKQLIDLKSYMTAQNLTFGGIK